MLQLLDDKKLARTDNLYVDFETPEGASKMWVYRKPMNSIYLFIKTFTTAWMWSYYDSF